MPRVAVLIDVPGQAPEPILSERIPPALLEDEHYAAQLVQRMGWAIVDADEREADARERFAPGDVPA